MRGLWSHISSDEGMTLVEIMAGMVILVIVLTAMLPMVFQITQMNAQTQAQTLLNNYVNSVIEEIRALPYQDIGISGSATLPGALEPTRTVLLDNGYTIDLTLDVQWVDDPELTGSEDYKEISITAEATAPDKQPTHFSTVTYVWGDDSTLAGPLPSVYFGTGAPTAEQIVSGTMVPVVGQAQAETEGGTIMRMSLKVDSDIMPDSSTPPKFAEFESSGTPVTVSWFWDTTAKIALLDENGLPLVDAEGHTIYSFFSPDGYRIIRVEAWDNLGTYNYVTRRVLVDNYPPAPTPEATATPYRSSEIRASWLPAADGTDHAAAYNLRLYLEPKTPQDLASWVVVPGETSGGATSQSFAAAPFSRYYVQVQSESARGLLESPEEWVSSETTTTAPELKATYRRTITAPSKRIVNLSYDVGLSVTPPTFLASGDVTYEVWRANTREGLGVGAPYKTLTNVTTLADSISGVQYTLPTGNVTTSTSDWYYRVKATFTPATEDTKSFSVWSNDIRIPGAVLTKDTVAGATSGDAEMVW